MKTAIVGQKAKNNNHSKTARSPKRKLPYQEIERLHWQGLTGVGIAKQLGLKISSVSSALRKMGLGAGWERHEREVLSDGRIRCCDCRRPKESSAFNPNSAVCRDCSYQRLVDKCNADFDRNLRMRWALLRANAKDKGVKFTITEEQFKAKYAEQNGRDFYDETTVLDIEFGDGLSDDRLSADRLDPDGPYSDENVVFTTHYHNNLRRRMDPATFKTKLLAGELPAKNQDKKATVMS
jgi:hypothetical protein